MEETTLNDLGNLFLALSDKTRLRLLSLMANGEVSVGYLADSLGESQPKISRHLAYLRNSGLVSTRRDGKWIYYVLQMPLDPTAWGVMDAAFGVRQTSKRLDAVGSQAKSDYEAGPSWEAGDNIFEETDMMPFERQELEIFLL